jgi:hypothetical protein
MSEINWEGFAPKKTFWILRERTRAVLHRHGAIDILDCLFCDVVDEDSDHLFTICPRLSPP